jgi:hypothetical protein
MSNFSLLGLLSLDHSDAADVRVVHGRLARRRGEGRDERARNAHLHHAVLPQVRPSDYNAGKFIKILISKLLEKEDNMGNLK